MNRIERYLGWAVVSYSLLVMFVLMTVFSFFEFMNQLGDINDDYTLSHASLFTLLKVPVYGYEVFPIILLIGTLMGLGSLANQSELTVLRVTGWSIKRILIAVLKTALIMWLVMAVIGEFVAPQSEAYAKKMKVEALNKSLSIGSGSGLWIKDGEQFIHVDRVLSSHELKGIKFYEMVGGNLQGVMQADYASYQNEWTFKQVRLLKFSQAQAESLPKDMPPLYQVKMASVPELQRDFLLLPEDLTNLDIESRYLSAFSLLKQIDFMELNGLDASNYQLSLWRKIAMPMVVIAMIAVVFPLIFGSMRQVSVGQRIFMGVLIGMGFHLLNQLVGNIAVVYHLPIWLAAISLPLILIGVSWYWLDRAE